MKGILTPEEKQYLRRVSNYLGSMGMQDGNIEIDIDNGWSFSYGDINWDYVSHFANNYNADIPSAKEWINNMTTNQRPQWMTRTLKLED